MDPVTIDPILLIALLRQSGGACVSVPADMLDSIEDRLPTTVTRLRSDELEAQLARRPDAGPNSGHPAVRRESGGFLSPADVDFAVDTVRSIRESGVGYVESIDLHRVLRILSAVRG